LDTLPQLVEWLDEIPVLVGASRKHFVCDIIGEKDVIKASVAFGKMAIERGAKILRVHDVSAYTAHG
jgi:dihydropteroate synthase